MRREVERESNVFCVEEKGVEGTRHVVMTRMRKDVDWSLGVFGEIAEAQ